MHFSEKLYAHYIPESFLAGGFSGGIWGNPTALVYKNLWRFLYTKTVRNDDQPDLSTKIKSVTGIGASSFVKRVCTLDKIEKENIKNDGAVPAIYSARP